MYVYMSVYLTISDCVSVSIRDVSIYDYSLKEAIPSPRRVIITIRSSADNNGLSHFITSIY